VFNRRKMIDRYEVHHRKEEGNNKRAGDSKGERNHSNQIGKKNREK